MKIRILLSLLVIIALSGSGTYAQKLYTAKDSISLGKDTIIRLTVPKYRGQIQWQRSLNGTTWADVENGKKDTLPVSTQTEALYRASVTDGTCLPVYSDSAVIVRSDSVTRNIINSSVSEELLISDSLDISNGRYIYKGTINKNEFGIGKIIINDHSGGTIRKITNIIQKGDTIITETEQATLEDLFIDTSFKLSTAMVVPTENLKHASMQELGKALTDQDGYIHPAEVEYFDDNGYILKKASIFNNYSAQGGTLYMHKDWSGFIFYDKSGTFTLPNENGTVHSVTGNVKSYISEGYFTFDPEFKFEFEFDKPNINWNNLTINKGEITKFKFYSDKSLIDFKNILAFESTVAYEYGKEWVLLPNIINSRFKFIVSGIPMWIDYKIDIRCRLVVDIGGGSVSAKGFQNTSYLTLGAGYENKTWHTINEIERSNKVFASSSGTLNSEIRFELYPSVEMKIYSILGPYFNVGPNVTINNSVSGSKNWHQSLDLGVDANVGVSVDILGKEVFSYNHGRLNFFQENLWKSPGKLLCVNGNNQTGQTGNVLSSPIVFKVTDTKNQPVENVQINLVPENGSVPNSILVSDANGLVQTTWKMAETSGVQKLSAFVLDGKNLKIPECSLEITATAKSSEFPSIITSPLTNITQNSATGGGNVSSDGGSTVLSKGVCWNQTGNPTIQDNRTTDGTGLGSFVSTLGGLLANTTYYVRAYATNSTGTGYGSQVTFTTRQAVSLPVLTTKAASQVTSTSALSGGNITSDGGATVTACGVCWSTAQNPTTSNPKTTDGSGAGSFTSSLTGLTPNTTYYIRAYASNSAGTAYGGQVTFTTGQNISLPEVSTSAITNITTTSATGGGNVTADGGASVTARGICWSTSQNPTTSNPKTTDGSGTGSFTSSLTGLTSNTTYYVRAYATNSAGTAYGSQVVFSTTGPVTGTESDVDGNVYKTVTIGTQTWMAENLKTTKYRDGSAIPLVTDGDAWIGLISGAYCWNYNDIGNKAIYGALYNWYAVNTGKLCPTGWHVPTDAEWTTLENFLINNGYNYDGTTSGNKIAKSLAKATGWSSTSGAGTVGNTDYPSYRNKSGFSALAGGFRDGAGSFGSIGNVSIWWSSSESSTLNAWVRLLICSYTYLDREPWRMECGFSVRCVRD